ncbi:MAG TPA: hypothetical protein VF862_02495 [Gemmatimonadales bacterium]
MTTPRDYSENPEHPALRIIGIGSSAKGDSDEDVARDHDRVLADIEEASWGRAVRAPAPEHRAD